MGGVAHEPNWGAGLLRTAAGALPNLMAGIQEEESPMSVRLRLRRLAVVSTALAGAALVAVASGAAYTLATAATAIEYGLIAAGIAIV
ncbi:hypothetical protein Prum_088640 [Phytohabitans rumicis]|uniref:Uncharacterized protein n=2 Tax=Phytohabitans rumicis TaxID=1076125 RepID=A0A6V8LDC0_9ACTN|nr:hypothetical protein Prum_088640 [Phytohabitans rumicis]